MRVTVQFQSDAGSIENRSGLHRGAGKRRTEFERANAEPEASKETPNRALSELVRFPREIQALGAGLNLIIAALFVFLHFQC